MAGSLTGNGERLHLANPQINLDTLIEDVARTIETEELSQVTLVGHSFGGMVITGVVHRMPTRIANLVYLDAAVPEPGESFFQAINFQPPPGGVPSGVWQLPPQAVGCDSAGVGLTDPEDGAWVDRRLTPQPIGTFVQPISFDWAGLGSVKKVYIRSLRPWFAREPFTLFHERAIQKGWATYDIDTGHDSMVSRPRELAALLRTIANRQVQ